ncbi:MAG TPA: GNAT family N-acetyltransferase [Deltaproteobacteria bacterium]|nr:GNAT family N-acetyltransferase [Deltaproteobacteria bacterium]HOI08114.1 GNAT family N-acetyltransferase [Deltaproteobacteria bacterium]
MSESGILSESGERARRRAEGSGAFFSMDFGSLLQEDTKAIIRKALKENRGCLMEHECKEILEAIGIKTTGGLVAESAARAVEISRLIGYPVAMKIVSPEVTHKTDGGGVKLDIRNDRAVRKAFREITDAFRHCKVLGVSVQKMAEPGIEAIVGVTRDPSFGPVLMFGLGGIFVEVLKDVTFRVLPITGDDAAEMIEEIKGSKLLKGYRGRTADIEELKGLLLKISRLVTEHPEIRELDLNPVFVYPSGCVAVDARIFVEEAQEQPSRKAVAGGNLRTLFYPKSIAVLGASDTPGKLGYNVFKNLLDHGFHLRGRIFPINRNKDLVLGVKAYKSVLDIQEDVDAAIIIVPAETVPLAIEECCAKGIKYLVVETAGFAEIGDSGREAQARIREIAQKKGCRILGPNCSGIINTHHDMVQSIGLLDTLGKGNVGLIAQAGVYAAGILAGLRNVLDFGIVATIGNKMDISETDILEYMGEDEYIDVIAMYMEDITSGKRFIDVANRISHRKPIIVLKTGRTEAGKQAVSSHTASLAGNDEINNAAFRQCGIIRARDNEHLFALMRGFSKQPLPKGPGVLIITYTGSLGVAATDMLYLNGLRLSTLEPHLKDRLATYLPGYLNLQNPVDCSFTMTPEQLKNIIEIGTVSSDVHSIIVIIQGEKLASFVDTLKGIDYKGKPVVCCVACKEFMIADVIRMEGAGIPVYSTSEMAAEVLGEMYRAGQRRRRKMLKMLDSNLADKGITIDGKPVRFRLLRVEDIDLWTDFVRDCSQESLWLRFLSPFSPTPERAKRYCDIDPEEEFAIVAEMNEGGRRKVIGIARLVKITINSNHEAEYAVIVSDPWQKKTLGHQLSEMSIGLARQWGIRSVLTETVRDNHAMIKILKRCNFKVDNKCGNMFSLSLRF